MSVSGGASGSNVLVSGEEVIITRGSNEEKSCVGRLIEVCLYQRNNSNIKK